MRPINSLVVEDDIITQKILLNILKDYGKCIVASNGVEGLNNVKSALNKDDHFDLISLDIEMPELDGVTLLEKIRELEKIKNVSKKSIIIMVTADGEKAIVKKCCILGCNSFIIKPVNKHSFDKIFRRYKIKKITPGKT